MTEGFDLDEIERLLDEGLCDPENLCEEGFAITADIIDQVPAMIARLRYLETENALMADNGCHLEAVISELRAENARLRELTVRGYVLCDGDDEDAVAFRNEARAALGGPQ